MAEIPLTGQESRNLLPAKDLRHFNFSIFFCCIFEFFLAFSLQTCCPVEEATIFWLVTVFEQGLQRYAVDSAN